MERTETRPAGFAQCPLTGNPLDPTPPMGEMLDFMFAGFAPIARAKNADAKERRAE